MRSALFSRNTRQWIIGALLVALVARALIPAGFMPATDRPFSFQICPDGLPAQVLGQLLAGTEQDPHAAHHHAGADHSHHHESGGSAPHEHNAARAEHCVFAAAATSALLAFTPTFAAEAASSLKVTSPLLPARAESLRFFVPPPRGPPALS